MAAMRVLDVFRSRRVLVIALLGFSSGLPYHLTGQTLLAWLTDEGLSLEAMAAFAAVGLPFTVKWLWAPLLDRYRLPFLGRRRGWLLVLQLALAAGIVVMGAVDPRDQPGWMVLAALGVSLISASQDIVVDAFNTDTLHVEERGAGGAMYVTGYRAGMLLSGAAALALADHLPWQTIYTLFAALVGVGVIGTLLAEEPPEGEATRPPRLVDAIARPFLALVRQDRIVVVLAFVALYKFGEHWTNQMMMPFLKREIGFGNKEVASFYHLLGFAGILLGGVVGGGLVARIGVRRCLIWFGALQASTNLAWAMMAWTDRSIVLLAAAVIVDNVTTMMGTAAFVAYLMSRCERSYSATQYAVLTSVSSVGSRVFGVLAGALVATAGWPVFWLCTALIAIPAITLVRWLPFDDRPAGTSGA
jgi:MFS transporter, PAT family, beta-lactamase induction signal transducer AmpG